MCIDTWNSVVCGADGKPNLHNNDATYVDFVKNLQEHIETKK